MGKRALIGMLIAIALGACRGEAPTATQVVVSVQETATVAEFTIEATSVPSTPTDVPQVKPDQVIVLSIPSPGSLPAMVAAPIYGMDGIEPATIAVAHNSLAAGRLPAEIGIVGERVHRPEDGIYWYTSAFDLPMQGAEPIWKQASDQGLVTAALFWAGATPALPDQMADYTVGYGQRDAYSAQHTLTLYTAEVWENAPTSHSLMQEGVFEIRGDEGSLATVFVLGIDESDDGIANPDSFVLSKDRVVGADDVTLRAGEWGRWMLNAEIGQGTDFLITAVGTNAITVFQSRVNRVLAAPDEMKQDLIAELGYFAPEPDFYGLGAGWITPDQYMEMVRRQSDWMMDATLWVNEVYQPDLLFTVQNPIHQAGQQFLLVDERQEGYSEERAVEYSGYMTQAEAQANQVVGRLLEVQGDNTAIMVVNPVALRPIHTRVNLNIALAEAGLLRLGSRGFVVMPATQAIGFSSGGAAHIYINAVGREEEGIVAAEDVGLVADQVVTLLQGMVDPETGEPIFAKVVRQPDAEATFAGDVFAQANVGYWLDDETNADAIFAPVNFYGQQGYDSDGWFSVIGWDVSRNDIDLVDIAPSIAWLLGFEMGETDGRSIFGE